MSPQTGSRRYTNTHLKWFMGTLVFSTLHCRDFSFFYFLFSFPRCFLSAFLIFVCLFAFCAFAWLRFCVFLCFLVLFGAFWCFFVLFCAFLCVQKLFVKINIKVKTALIISSILLLKFILLQA